MQKWDGVSHLFIFFGFLHLFSRKLILPFLFGYVFSSQQNKDFLLLSLSEPKKMELYLGGNQCIYFDKFCSYFQKKVSQIYAGKTKFYKEELKDVENLSDFQYHKIQKQKNPGNRSFCCCHCMQYHCLAIWPPSLVLFFKFTLPKYEVHIAIWLFCQVDFYLFPNSTFENYKVQIAQLSSLCCHVCIPKLPLHIAIWPFDYFAKLPKSTSPCGPPE